MATVFISVGTHSQQFDRLLKAVDGIAAKGKDNFFAQTGNCNYKPKNFPFGKFLSDSEYKKRFEWANIILSHTGAGTIINAMNRGKKLVIAPRLKRYGEHTNDHQLELAKAFEKQGKALAVFNMNNLERKIEQAKKFKPKIGSDKADLIKAIDNFLVGIEK